MNALRCFCVDASVLVAHIAAGWPAGFVPRALLAVDEKGKIPSGRNRSLRKRADTQSG
jgi:hypothetical protein